MKLHIPAGYPPTGNSVCNGCGSRGLLGMLIPNTVYGLDISECCNIHDYMYHNGSDANDKAVADIMFLCNMVLVVHHRGHRWLRWLRERRVRTYYNAVKYFGNSAFWESKKEI